MLTPTTTTRIAAMSSAPPSSRVTRLRCVSEGRVIPNVCMNISTRYSRTRIYAARPFTICLPETCCRCCIERSSIASMKGILKRLRELLSSWRGTPPSSGEPDAGVRVPLKRGPGGRSASAVAEFDES